MPSEQACALVAASGHQYVYMYRVWQAWVHMNHTAV